MLFGKVIGTVVASRKEEVLEGVKFLLIRLLDHEGRPSGSSLVAVDAVGAGVGEVVLLVSGSSARQTALTKDRPVDATIMAIVDLIEVEGRITYQK